MIKNKNKFVRRQVLSLEEAIKLLESNPGFLESLTPEQKEIALNAPEEAEIFGKIKSDSK